MNEIEKVTQIISDGNKLVMDFMGKEYAQWTFQDRMSWISARKTLESHTFEAFDSYDKIPYNKSFDWLVPVIKKIDKLPGDLEVTNKKLKAVNCLRSYDLDYCWRSVIVFLYWYKDYENC